MTTFLDRVNARLPVHQPDGVLLALVQGQRVEICGASCPSGQTAHEGRCVPIAVLSRGAPREKGILATLGWSTTVTVAPKLSSSAPIEGQMALAGPKAEIRTDPVKTDPIQPSRGHSPIASGDWRSELWKRLPN
jgi:hypothetical protein